MANIAKIQKVLYLHMHVYLKMIKYLYSFKYLQKYPVWPIYLYH